MSKHQLVIPRKPFATILHLSTSVLNPWDRFVLVSSTLANHGAWGESRGRVPFDADDFRFSPIER